MSAALDHEDGEFIFLYGPPGAGKTTVGRILADALARPFYDLDGEIEAAAGRSVPELFAAEGEGTFRARERRALGGVLAREAGVVALGGGALLDAASRAQAETAGAVLLLEAAPEALAGRLAAGGPIRPLLAGAGDPAARLEALLAARAEHYASFPLRLAVNGLTPEEAAWQAQVRLGAFYVRGMGPGYDVRVRPGGLARLGARLHARGLRGPLALVSDAHVAGLHAGRAAAALEGAGYAVHGVTFPAGEEHKTLATAARLWEAFLDAGLERGSTVVALGGGVTSDLAGFAAAAYLRSVAWAAVPTTLLAMVDAGLGGKTGVDLPHGKNLVGAFYPPAFVLADTDLLATLPAGELRSGLAEALKHGLLGDPALFELCMCGLEELSGRWDELVRRAVAVKVRLVSEDPYERGPRAALNLGHTVGHALEQASGYRLRHGEAVAIGLVLEARLAERLGLAEAGLARRVAAALDRLGLPAAVPAWIDRAAVLAALRVDKKRAGGQVRFSLPVRVGEVVTGVAVEFKSEWLEVGA